MSNRHLMPAAIPSCAEVAIDYVNTTLWVELAMLVALFWFMLVHAHVEKRKGYAVGNVDTLSVWSREGALIGCHHLFKAPHHCCTNGYLVVMLLNALCLSPLKRLLFSCLKCRALSIICSVSIFCSVTKQVVTGRLDEANAGLVEERAKKAVQKVMKGRGLVIPT